jgi:carboxymethylenebutenolidase
MRRKAGVAFYGPLAENPTAAMPQSPTMLAAEIKAPVLGLYGEAEVEAIRAALEAPGKTLEFKIYPGAARLPRRLPAELPQGRG